MSSYPGSYYFRSGTRKVITMSLPWCIVVIILDLVSDHNVLLPWLLLNSYYFRSGTFK